MANLRSGWNSRPGYHVAPGFVAVQEAFQYRRSGFMAEVRGSVIRMLQTEKAAPYLQKFTLRMQHGQTVLVIHNRESGGEVPLSIGDEVLVRGEYLWSETGGTIRFTERDFSAQRRHGWIEHKGQVYR